MTALYSDAVSRKIIPGYWFNQQASHHMSNLKNDYFSHFLQVCIYSQAYSILFVLLRSVFSFALP